MTELDFLRQEIATLQAEHTRQRSHLHEKTTQMLQQTNLIEQKDCLLGEQSATIRKQQEKLAEQQLEINRLIQQAFGRRSERYLESPQQRKIDLALGRLPIWVDDPFVDLSYHLRHVALPRPGDERQLKRMASRVFSQALDREKPAWELVLVEGLDDGRFALIVRPTSRCSTAALASTRWQRS